MNEPKVCQVTAIPDAEGYITAVPTSDLIPDQMTIIEWNGKKVILTRFQGQVCAFAAYCPHAAADLTQGDLYKGKIKCPDHGYIFDVRNGRILWPEDETLRLKRYEVKEENQQIKVRL